VKIAAACWVLTQMRREYVFFENFLSLSVVCRLYLANIWVVMIKNKTKQNMKILK
jgi:hypothetical protein